MPAALKTGTEASIGSSMMTRTLTPRDFAAVIAERTFVSVMYMTSTSSEVVALLMWLTMRADEFVGETIKRVHMRFAGVTPVAPFAIFQSYSKIDWRSAMSSGSLSM